MKKALFAILLALSGIACGQTRIEADAGAANLLSLAQRDFERTKSEGRLPSVLTNSTAGALAKLCRGEIVVAGTARVAEKAERELCAREKVELIELPVAMDALAVVVNPSNTWAKQLSAAELKRAWLDTPAKAVSWKQINSVWPETPLKLYGPAPKTGLATYARAALSTDASASAPALRTDISATEVLSVVAEGVARDRAGLGLLDRATYVANMKRVRLVPVEGIPAFPLYVYTSAKALQDPGIKAYLDYLFVNGARLAPQAGLAPLSDSTYQQARQHLAGNR